MRDKKNEEYEIFYEALDYNMLKFMFESDISCKVQINLEKVRLILKKLV